jgi:CBS domain-containing protein
LRAARLGLAVVVDQKKNFRGIVTLEDLIRRLVSSGSAGLIQGGAVSNPPFLSAAD